MYSLTKEKGKLTEKVLYINSIDRDVNKWSNANNFEIQLPETYKNVVQIELMSSQFYLYIQSDSLAILVCIHLSCQTSMTH